MTNSKFKMFLIQPSQSPEKIINSHETLSTVDVGILLVFNQNL